MTTVLLLLLLLQPVCSYGETEKKKKLPLYKQKVCIELVFT